MGSEGAGGLVMADASYRLRWYAGCDRVGGALLVSGVMFCPPVILCHPMFMEGWTWGDESVREYDERAERWLCYQERTFTGIICYEMACHTII